MIFSKLLFPVAAIAAESAVGPANFVEEYVEIYSMCAESKQGKFESDFSIVVLAELLFHQEGSDELNQELMAHIGDACDNFTR